MTAVRIILGVVITCIAGARAEQTDVVIENEHVRYSIAPDGRNLGFVDRATGIDYLKRDRPSSCALVRRDGKEHPATSVSSAGGRLTLRFGEANVEAALRVQSQGSYIRLTVESIAGGQIESLVFLNIPLTLKGRPEEPFGSCAFSLNLITRVDQLPALQTELRAACYRKFGLAGANPSYTVRRVNRLF